MTGKEVSRYLDLVYELTTLQMPAAFGDPDAIKRIEEVREEIARLRKVLDKEHEKKESEACELVIIKKPAPSCSECPYAGWTQYIDGVISYGCDMSHCYLADERECGL